MLQISLFVHVRPSVRPSRVVTDARTCVTCLRACVAGYLPAARPADAAVAEFNGRGRNFSNAKVGLQCFPSDWIDGRTKGKNDKTKGERGRDCSCRAAATST